MTAANNTGLQVSQRDQTPQFLSFEKPVDILKAFGINSNGLPDRTSWLLCPRTRRSHEVGGVAADGFAALSNYFSAKVSTLYLQRLGTNGLPLGDPVVVASSGIKAVDLTSASSSATRFVVYMTNAGDLMLQVVDATTGAMIGNAIHLN